ncbi:hypothetical protein CMI39_04045 [Candidatus Pacearchaeota archaeon]|nr:hypothetical protein [Candidatus Pacearchaeota archaeon]
MAYFKYFDTINYDVRGIKNKPTIDSITNILKRVRMKVDFVKYQSFFAMHTIIDGETPEYLAHEYYGDAELHWVVLYAQQMTNPYYDWPLRYYDLKKFVTKKYGTANINALHHYEDADKFQVDSTAAGAIAVTNFIHEETLNDAKRNINLVRPEFVPEIVTELKFLLK